MNRLIEAHPETTRPVVDKVFPFDQAADAWAHLESQKHVGKIVIQVAQN
jgi:NADPH:quinone reductase-like Zn-dependent oxidoreductase